MKLMHEMSDDAPNQHQNAQDAGYFEVDHPTFGRCEMLAHWLRCDVCPRSLDKKPGMISVSHWVQYSPSNYWMI